jgi:hypothetical protein
MKQKQFTINFEFNNSTDHSLNFLVAEPEVKEFDSWFMKAISDPNNKWLCFPADNNRSFRTLVNVENITKVEIHDTTHLLPENPQEEEALKTA